MHKEIVNRVSNSKLVTIDLEEFYPLGERILFDIKKWLFEETVLKEKDFRESVKNHDWSQYKDAFVALHCSTDAIIPSWANLLVATNLAPYTKRVVVGDIDKIESILFNEIINKLDVEFFRDKLILVKGCASKPIPQNAYVQLIEKLIPVASSIMYGEACSNVPLYKKAKN
ncbi:MAG: DUF2480 family protein [Flavobacteriaceae bacterium]|nr:DUF2480 family protein [Flavobacteriaceae bacterium]